MCYRCNATVLLLSALACLSLAGCSNEKDRDKDRSTSRPAAAPDEIVVDWWETKDSKEKNRSAVIVGARIPSGMLFVPSPKNPGSLEWRYKDLKLICADGSSITAEGVHLGFHGEGAPFYKIEKFATEPGRYALTQNDSMMFLVEKDKVVAGNLKLQVKNESPVPLSEVKRRRAP